MWRRAPHREAAVMLARMPASGFLRLQPDIDKPADGLGPSREVFLLAAPVVRRRIVRKL
jgi:hypothetical protein